MVLSCGDDTTGIDLDSPPPAPRGFKVINDERSVTVRWDFLDEVAPSVSFSGYQVLMREGENDDTVFFPAISLEFKPSDGTRLPLIKRRNSLAGDHMEVRVLALKAGSTYQFRVIGLQNGLAGPPSGIETAVPFRVTEEVSIRDESEIYSWFYFGELSARYSAPDKSLIGYDFDPDSLSHSLLWVPIADGGQLRVQRAGAREFGEMAPEEGYIDDPEEGSLELAQGDGFWIHDTGGPETPDDDYYARIDVKRIVVNSSERRIVIDCAYQPRPNTRNF